MKQRADKQIKGWLMLLFLLASLTIGLYGRSFVKAGLAKAGILKAENSAYYSTTPLNVAFKDITDKPLKLSQHRGKVIFITFWASWCPTCRQEMPSINRLYNRMAGNREVVFLTVDIDKDPTQARRYMKANNYNFPVVREIQKTPENIFPGEIPLTIILDRRGKIVYRYSGEIDFDKPEVAEVINRALKR